MELAGETGAILSMHGRNLNSIARQCTIKINIPLTADFYRIYVLFLFWRSHFFALAFEIEPGGPSAYQCITPY